jgi:hypothetical protein
MSWIKCCHSITTLIFMKELVLKKSCPCVFYLCCKCMLGVAKLGKEFIVNLVLQHLGKKKVFNFLLLIFNVCLGEQSNVCALVNSSLSMWRCLYMTANLIKCELQLDGQLIFTSLHVLVMNTYCK